MRFHKIKRITSIFIMLALVITSIGILPTSNSYAEEETLTQAIKKYHMDMGVYVTERSMYGKNTTYTANMSFNEDIKILNVMSIEEAKAKKIDIFDEEVCTNNLSNFFSDIPQDAYEDTYEDYEATSITNRQIKVGEGKNVSYTANVKLTPYIDFNLLETYKYHYKKLGETKQSSWVPDAAGLNRIKDLDREIAECDKNIQIENEYIAKATEINSPARIAIHKHLRDQFQAQRAKLVKIKNGIKTGYERQTIQEIYELDIENFVDDVFKFWGSSGTGAGSGYQTLKNINSIMFTQLDSMSKFQKPTAAMDMTLIFLPTIIEYVEAGAPVPVELITDGEVPIHKWYYDDNVLTNTSTSSIKVTDSYNIQDESEYKVSEWIITDAGGTKPKIWSDITPSNSVVANINGVLTQLEFSGNTTGLKGSINWQMPPRKELYIKYDNGTAAVTGDMLVTEKFISKTYKLSDKVSLGANEITSKAAPRCKGHKTADGIKYCTLIVNDGHNNIVLDNREPINTSIQSLGSGFKFVGINTKKEINAGGGEINTEMVADGNVVLARMNDLPTLASYKSQSKAVSDLANLGVTPGKVPNKARAGQYVDTLKIRVGSTSTPLTYLNALLKLEASGNPDYRRSGSLSPDCGPWTRGTSVSPVYYEASVGVQSYTGAANVGNSVPENVNNTSFAINGINFDKANRIVSNTGANLTWYPYVQMAYQKNTYETAAGDSGNMVANVLANHLSTLNNRDVVEIGWVSGYANRLKLDSNMWSSHANAKKQSHKVLPGGSLYSLSTPSKQQVGVTVWQTEISNDFVRNIAVNNGNYYSTSAIDARRNALLSDIRNSIEQLDMTLWVDNWAGTGSPFVNKIGMNLFKNQKVNGVTLIDYEKYLLLRNVGRYNENRVNEADLDVKQSYTGKTTYTLQSSINGSVTVFKNWAPLITISKTQGLSDLLANAEVRTLDEKTKAVTNFLNSIDRNKGHDGSIAVENQAWYNEAVDAINVVKTDYILDTGIMVPEARVAALNPNLCPPSTGVANQYTRFLLAGFKLDNYTQRTGLSGVNNCVAVYNSTNILIPNMDRMLVSNYFLIPNATVMDLN